MSTDPLLQPFQLKHLTLRNRIMSTAHAPGYVENGHPKERYRLYHEEKAKGGIGLTIIGGSTNIAPDSPSVFGQLYAGDDSIIPWFQKLTDGVKAHGAAVMCQITHMGRRTAWDDGHWLPVAGPSAARERAHRAYPKVMEAEDIARVIEQFAAAAVRCKAGGFDGIELLSHSHLLGQFLSPHVNHREDAYGGSLQNRLAITLEVLNAIRTAVGPDFIVGIRATGDERKPDGLSPNEAVKAAQILAHTGQVDFLNILAGAPYDDLGLAEWVPPMGLPSARDLGVAARIRQSVHVPIFHAGGVADLATARHAVADGQVDLIGMTRAHMADPYLVQKLIHNQEERIRPCVGLGYCVDRVNQGKDAVCGHNASTGREQRMPHQITPAEGAKRVLVIGGGVAGLEAARISALRGHNVTVFEASDRLGGQLNLAANAPSRRQIWGVAQWLIDEVNMLGVDVQMNRFVEVEDISIEKADAIIVATGGWPQPIEVPGAELIDTTWQVLSGEVRATGDVMIVDESGNHAALVAAEALAHLGCNVHHVTPDRATALELGPTNSATILKTLAEKNVAFTCFQEIVAVAAVGNRKEVHLRHVLSGEQSVHLVDHIVTEDGCRPSEDIFFALKTNAKNLGQLDQSALVVGGNPWINNNPSGQYWLARIGDAVASRNIHAALYDALRVCKDL